MDELLTLRGVARKTANVVLGNAFNINHGVVVDTHVMRISNRLGLTTHKKNTLKIEKDLMALFPRDTWTNLSHLLIHHRSEEHTSELQSRGHLVCRLLLEKK